MTKEDVLWVAFKVLGLYFIVKGLTTLSSFAFALLSGMSIRGMGGMMSLSGLLPVAVGVYLLLDGRVVLKLAADGRRASSAEA